MTTTWPSRAMVGSTESIFRLQALGFGPQVLRSPEAWSPEPAAMMSQQPSVEGQRQQVLESVYTAVFGEVGQHHLEVAAELPQDLPARPARRRRGLGVGDHGNARETPMPL